jgi:hypothetical protein
MHSLDAAFPGLALAGGVSSGRRLLFWNGSRADDHAALPGTHRPRFVGLVFANEAPLAAAPQPEGKSPDSRAHPVHRFALSCLVTYWHVAPVF